MNLDIFDQRGRVSGTDFGIRYIDRNFLWGQNCAVHPNQIDRSNSRDRCHFAGHSQMSPKIWPVGEGFVVDLDDGIGEALSHPDSASQAADCAISFRKLLDNTHTLAFGCPHGNFLRQLNSSKF